MRAGRSTAVIDCQKLVFDWAASQPAVTGAAVLGAGLLYGFQGIRMIRFLILPVCAGAGCLLGLSISQWTPAPAWAAMTGVAILGVVLGLVAPRSATVLANGVTWAALGAYFASQLGMKEVGTLLTGGVLGLLGTVFAVLSREAAITLSTTLQGAALMVVGFVGLSSNVLPSLGTTFRRIAGDYSLVVPLLLTMLAITAYSIQASTRQGDLLSGSQPGGA